VRRPSGNTSTVKNMAIVILIWDDDSLFPEQLSHVALIVTVKDSPLCRLCVVAILAAIHANDSPWAEAYDRLACNAVRAAQILECEGPADYEAVSGVIVQDDIQVRVET
jgi:hypothetical protein